MAVTTPCIQPLPDLDRVQMALEECCYVLVGSGCESRTHTLYHRPSAHYGAMAVALAGDAEVESARGQNHPVRLSRSSAHSNSADVGQRLGCIR